MNVCPSIRDGSLYGEPLKPVVLWNAKDLSGTASPRKADVSHISPETSFLNQVTQHHDPWGLARHNF